MKSDLEFHRKMGARCFNRAWELLEKKRRTKEQDREMLQLAHASRYHWGVAGTARNLTVGEWQISRVYVALGEPRLALEYAVASLSRCEKEGLAEIHPPSLEGMARAYSAAGDAKSARLYLSKAKKELEASGIEAEDRRIFEAQIRETEAMLPK